MGKKKSDAFVKTSKKRFEVADASEVRLGVGGNFRAEQIGTLGLVVSPETSNSLSRAGRVTRSVHAAYLVYYL